MESMKTRLSLLWAFATLNYLYCDVLQLMDRSLLNGFLSGNINGFEINQGFLFASGVLVEIPIAMFLLSTLLPVGASRWANVLAGATMTLVQAATLAVKPPTLYYTFFSVIEIATTALIVWYAWRWAIGARSLTSRAKAGAAAVSEPSLTTAAD